MMDVAAWRSRFPILSRHNYLINNSLGAMPETVPGRLAEFARLWETEGVEAWDVWFPLSKESCGLFGRLIGAAAPDVCLVNNVTTATAAILSALDFSGPRRRVVTTTGEFTSVRYVLDAWTRYGAEVIAVAPDQVAAAVDERTALVAVSHVLFRTGRLLDLGPIAGAARRHGALFFVDAYQSVGVVPIDVQAMGIDLLAAGVLKWCCGGPGAAYLYVAPGVQHRLEPAVRGWLGHEQPFRFEPEMRFAPGAWRFALSSLTMPSVYAAMAGMEAILAAGVAQIRARSLALTGRLVAAAQRCGIPVISPVNGAERGGHVTLNPPDAARVARALIARGIRVDYRQDSGIRVAPHFFNTEAEVDEAAAAMAQLAGLG